MTKPELVAKLRRELADIVNESKSCDNPAGYSSFSFLCDLSRARLAGAEALPDGWEGDGDAVANKAGADWMDARTKHYQKLYTYWDAKRFDP